jgi:hypothetical protein
MATQTRISKWANKVSQSMEMPSPTIPQHHSPDHYQPRSRPSYSQPHSQTHSRSNSVSRSHSRELPHYHREQSSYRPRSHSQSSSRPHATRSYTFAQPTHSRTYSYALNRPPPPMPMPLPPPVPYLHPAPRRSRTLPDQPHQVLYHKYDAPRGGPTYVIGAPGVGGVPPQIRMHNAVRIPHSFFPIRMAWVLTTFSCCRLFLVGHADETVPTTAAQAPVYEFRTVGVFLYRPLAKIQAPVNQETP